LDDIDHTLLGALRADGRASWAELGRLVGLSAPSVADRVARLEATGAITGYHAAVDPRAAGLGVSALVGLYRREGAHEGELAEALRAVAAIEDCWFVAGDEELVVRVRVSDVDALERTLGEVRRIHGVARTRTTVVLSTRWEGQFPLGQGPPPVVV